jgi:hypothetical protein
MAPTIWSGSLLQVRVPQEVLSMQPKAQAPAPGVVWVLSSGPRGSIIQDGTFLNGTH